MNVRVLGCAGSGTRTYHIPSYERTELNELDLDKFLEHSSRMQDVFEMIVSLQSSILDEQVDPFTAVFALDIIGAAFGTAFADFVMDLYECGALSSETLEADTERMRLRRDLRTFEDGEYETFDD